MKILIGYDGSKSADGALDDLKRAGLPGDSEVLVISVGDLLMNSPTDDEITGATLTPRLAASFKRGQNFTASVIKEAEEFATKAADRLRLEFPAWKVSSEVVTGKPVWELIDAASRSNTDLAVVGSQGRSAIGRLLLGSVSKRLSTDAGCSVRVARGTINRTDRPTRIILGVDGSPAAEQAIYAVAQRVWDDGSEVKLISVDDNTPVPARISTFLPQATEMVHGYFQKREARVRSMLDWATGELGHTGLKTSVLIKKGHASKVLMAEARKWNADSIFVGTRDFYSAFERFRLGSVSTAVVTNAHCTVEIVRPFPEGQE